jgi:hypothetical protein
VEQARYQAERGRRQFDRVEPENRLVARSLERAWEQRLGELARRQDDLARFKASRPTPLSTQEWRWLQTAGADLAAVWHAPTTSDRDRKQLLRCLITEVVVTVDRARAVADLTVVWAGGATSTLSSKLNHSGGHRHATTTEVLALIRRLAVHTMPTSRRPEELLWSSGIDRTWIATAARDLLEDAPTRHLRRHGPSSPAHHS